MALGREEATLETLYVESQVFCHLIVKACSVLYTVVPKHFVMFTLFLRVNTNLKS